MVSESYFRCKIDMNLEALIAIGAWSPVPTFVT